MYNLVSNLLANYQTDDELDKIKLCYGTMEYN